ncbi:MAG: glutaredoxin family protein [Euryarchaeota archaeon]|nr:glutaredoxin family protein [Euryarchaeota archaeon]MBU4222253.1 glutaredoxin family protein [Euryarchaeota archaeon]MBU4453497.1 glutaredoxin family protein [Euryarchaeota archaeon]MCG2738245.1 glutaredoxin family protein [Candidatus Methanoperedenaceae archaeon]
MTKKIRPMLYTLSTCVHCAATKRFLSERGIEYDYVDVDLLEGEESEKIRDEVLKVSGGFRFPTIVVGKKVIVGFYEDKLREALGL